MEAFQALQRPRSDAALVQSVLSWALLLAVTALVCAEPLTLPLALLLFASRLRALGNVMHDASHGNLGRRVEWLGHWLIAAPLFEDLKRYRTAHLLHHARLGDPAGDPDFIQVPLDGSGQPLYRDALGLYLHFATTPRVWLDNTFGEVGKLTWRARGRVLLCWLLLLAALAAVGSPGFAATFFGLWMLSRATTFHLVKVFTELSDHVGLQPGSIIGFTRNSPSSGLLRHLLHPHNDGYHLTHHMAPRVPMVRLPQAHRLLSGMDAYREGHLCDGYFLGEYPVVASWMDARPLPTASAARRSRPRPVRLVTGEVNVRVSE